MRAKLLVLSALFLASFGARAQVSVQGFSWAQNSRFELRMTLKNQAVVIKGDLRDGARQAFPSKDNQISVELKSYTTELFVVAAVTVEGDETGYIFLLERPQTDWALMNTVAIKARKLGIMDDFETAMKDFKTITDFSLANSMRKTVEYFANNPNKRMQDLLSALENRDESLRVLPRPRTGPSNGGVTPGQVPYDAGPVNRPSAPVAPAAPSARPGIVLPSPDDEPEEPVRPQRRLAPRPPGSIPTAPPPSDDEDWVARERARLRRQRQLQQQQQAPVYRDPYGYPSQQGRPMDLRPRQPQYSPQPQYAPQRPAYPPQRERGFFEQLFGQ